MQMTIQVGRVASVNVGTPREIVVGGRRIRTSIWKDPVPGSVAIRGEDLDWWSATLGQQLASGTFGENLTTDGIDVSGARVGERWQAATCYCGRGRRPPAGAIKLEARMDRPGFITEFIDGGRPGAYLRIVEEGEVAAGDAVRVLSRPEGAPSVAEVMAEKTKRAE